MFSTVVPASQAARTFSLPLEAARLGGGGSAPATPPGRAAAAARQPSASAFGRGGVGSGFGRRAAYGLRPTPSDESRRLVRALYASVISPIGVSCKPSDIMQFVVHPS